MLVVDNDGTGKSFNFRETAPLSAREDMYKGHPEKAVYTGSSVAVPGEVRGYADAHALYGKLPWSRLFQESINMTRYGTKVTPELGRRLQLFKEFLLADPDWSFLHYDKENVLKEGDNLYRREFANTLEEIANNGYDAFYNGRIAESLVDCINRKGGNMTMRDLHIYNTSITDPLVGWYRGRKVYTCPSPASGPVLIEALNILEGYNLFQTGEINDDNLHLLIEAMKWGSAGRTELGDPFDNTHNNTFQVERLLTKDYASQIRQNISTSTTYSWQHYHPSYAFIENHGTTHISVIDKFGMAVSLTSTVNLIFGSRIHDVNTGVILNDEMDDFSQLNVSNAFHLEPSIYNFIKPGKRPLSSSTPTIILSPITNSVELVLGASGGSRIVTAVIDACIKYLDWNFDLQRMIEAPRVHHQLLPNVVSMEEGYSDSLIKGLRRRGHIVDIYPKEKCYSRNTSGMQNT